MSPVRAASVDELRWSRSSEPARRAEPVKEPASMPQKESRDASETESKVCALIAQSQSL